MEAAAAAVMAAAQEPVTEAEMVPEVEAAAAAVTAAAMEVEMGMGPVMAAEAEKRVAPSFCRHRRRPIRNPPAGPVYPAPQWWE